MYKITNLKLEVVNPFHIEWIKVPIFRFNHNSGSSKQELKVFNGVEGSHTYTGYIKSELPQLDNIIIDHFSKFKKCPKPFRYACNELRVKDIEIGMSDLIINTNNTFSITLFIYDCKEII